MLLLFVVAVVVVVSEQQFCFKIQHNTVSKELISFGLSEGAFLLWSIPPPADSYMIVDVKISRYISLVALYKS